MFRCVALGHLVWGAALLLFATWALVSTFSILPHMSTGSVWKNLLGTVVFAMTTHLPVAGFGVWMVILGRRLWSVRPGLRTALLWTHGILLVIGTLAVAVGIYSMGAAARSAARGGGLLGPIAIIPLFFGVPVVVLAVCSVALALMAIPRVPSREDDVTQTARRHRG